MYFGSELRFGLVKNINQDISFINLAIPDVILKFLNRYSSELNININKLAHIESSEIRYLYNEEVEEMRDLAFELLKSLEKENSSQIFQEYRDILNLNEMDFSKEDVCEVFHHLIHICNTALNGHKILYVLAGYDDSSFVGG